MSDLDELKAILKLMDDESPIVRGEVESALKRFGADLEAMLDSIQPRVKKNHRALALSLAGLRREGRRENSNTKFMVGQIVHHRRYHYRGVIVHHDGRCEADDGWYRANRTQPLKDQPWYHVLVDGLNQVTYVAETNLEPDSTKDRVVHPFVAHFFERFEGGAYVRNDRPWPDIWNL